MNYEQAKDQIWKEFFETHQRSLIPTSMPSSEDVNKLNKRIAELYADSVARDALQKAIDKFEGLKKQSQNLRDVIYLDGVLAVLDAEIKNYQPK